MNLSRHLVKCSNLGRKLPSPAGRFLLRDISFELSAGEVLAVTGPSGAGKSTLLRLLNRLDEPTEGTLLLDGTDYRDVPPQQLRQRVGMIMQRAYLFPGTVAENIRFGPQQTGRALADREIDDLLAQIGLTGYSSRDASTLSGGEAQRVSLARALACRPEVLLLDEPTSALDETNRTVVEDVLTTLIRERRLTCIWVTHHMDQARGVADRVLRLEAGAMVAFGAPEEVLR